ncbi:xanthine dehydrogenase accessory protein XdhC [Marinobacterium zhoushanense]|uniref:Xanthine dehydrogenase accessory protein XdhC n=1 Tax=Marinobacterium zhoushanense TaxID=1679163 RepID=A0ABQ1KD71_9GAMM|nr:xanthine dehydrogenase accessory protein XdhC [Marinobacterium zhoushanense]GGB92268.1 xanthine dehydrogenase accessory protein XdhC [Marinobacterium zhoushanense]
MISWGEALAELQRKGEAYVMVTLIGTRGSTPRESGSKMIVTAEHSFDTIGGGNLEFQVIGHARELLCTDSDSQSLEQYPLGASLGQCCGGQVSVLFEHFAARGNSLLVFGAGHVAKALVPILAELPLRIRWVDSREQEFPSPPPERVTISINDDPVEEIEQAAPGHWILVLTHNHQLDFELTEAALNRGDVGYLGVIGSETKARRFRQRLAHRGFSEAQIEQMICPVGMPEIGGKRPMEVAVSIAAQLISHYQSRIAATPKRSGVEWRQLQSLLALDADSADPNNTQSDSISTRNRNDT